MSNELTHNSDIHKNCAHATSDTAHEIIYSPPQTVSRQCYKHTVIIIAILNERAMLKYPVYRKCDCQENIKHDDDGI